MCNIFQNDLKMLPTRLILVSHASQTFQHSTSLVCFSSDIDLMTNIIVFILI